MNHPANLAPKLFTMPIFSNPMDSNFSDKMKTLYPQQNRVN